MTKNLLLSVELHSILDYMTSILVILTYQLDNQKCK